MARKASCTWDTVREVVGSLPGVEEGTSYGTPALKVRGKLFARFHQDGESLVVAITEADRRKRMKDDPETFYITDHYAAYEWMLVRLAVVSREGLSGLLYAAWRLRAPQRLLAEYDADK